MSKQEEEKKRKRDEVDPSPVFASSTKLSDFVAAQKPSAFLDRCCMYFTTHTPD